MSEFRNEDSQRCGLERRQGNSLKILIPDLQKLGAKMHQVAFLCSSKGMSVRTLH